MSTRSFLLSHLLSRAGQALQVDSPLAFVLATRLWQLVSGPVTLTLLLHYLVKAEQGVYYGILGVVGIQAWFELGLLSVLVGHASHEFAALQQASAAGGDDTAASPAHSRMQMLIRSSTRWFAVGSLLYAITAVGIGWKTLSASTVAWQGPLLAVVALSAVTVSLSPSLSILEGVGYRELIYRSRLLQAVLGSLVVWGSLVGGLKLWTLALSSAVQTAVILYVRYLATADFWDRFRGAIADMSVFSWTREILPSQWRVAAISLAFHFATQFFVIIVIMFHGDAAGAALGMTLTVTNAVQTVAAAWVQSRYPVISQLLGAGQREMAGTMWRRTALISTGILILASAVFTAAIACLPFVFPQYVDNFLTPGQILLLSVGNLAGHLASLQGFYVLARKARPLVTASLIGALTTGIAVWVSGYYAAVDGIVTAYALSMSLVLVPVHTYAYLRFRKKSDQLSVG